MFQRSVSYSSTYPSHYTDPFEQGEEDGGGGTSNRLAPVYEYITENWQVTLSYIDIPEEGMQPRIYVVTKVEYTPPPDLIGEPTFWEYSTALNTATIRGTWQRVFERNEFDFRMNNETVIVDIDTQDIGYTDDDLGEGAYGPVEFRPDPRIAVEGSFTITMDAYFNGAKVGTEIDTAPQTVLNNWDANRRRLLDYRDEPLRGENEEALTYGSSGNSGDVELQDDGTYELLTPGSSTVDPVLVEPPE